MTDRHVALVGFMGAGKSTLAWRAAEQTGRGYVDVDSDLEGLIGPIGAYFDEHGEAAFRGGRGGRRHRGAPPQRAVDRRARRRRGHVGGDARAARRARGHGLARRRPRHVLAARVRGGDRPLARDRDEFERLYEERRALYAERRRRRRPRRPRRRPRGGRRARRARRDPPARRARARRRRDRARQRPARRGHPRHGRTALPRRAARAGARAAARRGGEDARPRSTGSGRSSASTARGTLVALGGGCTTDAAGFAAATYLRGIAWVPVPSSLVAPGRRRDRRQDRDRPAAGEEPRRRVPLARADDRRPGPPRDAAAGAAPRGHGRSGEDRAARERAALGAARRRARPPLRRLQGRRLPPRPPRPRRARRC